MIPYKNFRNFRFQNQILEVCPKMAMYHFGDSRKFGGVLKEMLPEIIFASRNKQKMSFSKFPKWSKKGQKFQNWEYFENLNFW